MDLSLHVVVGLDPEMKGIFLQAIADAKAQRESNLTALNRIEQKVDRIIMDNKLITDALDKIDAATTKIAANEQIVADSLQTVSSEIDEFKKALADAGTSPALIAKAESLGTRVQAASDFLDSQVPVLQGIAAKGHTDPVPVPVPPPPPAVPPAG